MMDHYLFWLCALLIGSLIGNICLLRETDRLEEDLEKQKGGDDEGEKGE